MNKDKASEGVQQAEKEENKEEGQSQNENHEANMQMDVEEQTLPKVDEELKPKAKNDSDKPGSEQQKHQQQSIDYLKVTKDIKSKEN